MNNLYLRNLAVPFLSQRKNTYIWKSYYTKEEAGELGKPTLAGTLKESRAMAAHSCNVTSLAMVLHYLGVTNDSPDTMMKYVFEPDASVNADENKKKLAKEAAKVGSKIFEGGLFMQRFAEVFYGVQSSYSNNGKETGIKYIKDQIANGNPVIISCGILRYYADTEWIAISKKEAMEAIFGNENTIEYDVKINEYEKTIKEKEAALKTADTEIKQEIQKILEETKKATETLKKKYTQIYDFKLEQYRYQGHIIVIRGFVKIDNKEHVIINDPWGDYRIFQRGKGQYDVSMIGDNIAIPIAEFEKQYNKTKDTFWQVLVLHHNQWNFVLRGEQFNPVSPDFFTNCYKTEIYDYGGYPMKRSNLWHNGIHLKGSEGTLIYPLGPGQIIAARVRNNGAGDDTAPLNGSRCFVLVKHYIRVKEKLEEFYSLYMHLQEITELEKIIEEYPQRKTGIEWFDELLYRSKPLGRIAYSMEPEYYEVDGSETPKKIGTLPNAALLIVYDKKKEVDNRVKIYFFYEDNKIIKKCWAYVASELSGYNKTKEYEDKLKELKSGKIVYFTDLSENVIEVNGGSPIGRIGRYGGYDSNNQKETIHIEVFSNDIIIPASDRNELTIIRANEVSRAMCDREELIELFESKKLYDGFIDKFLYLKQDRVITKEEMLRFYKDKSSENLRRVICQHVSEWWADINWEQEYTNAKGVPNKNFLAFLPIVATTGEKLEGTLQEYVKHIYIPYKWFTHECINAMEASSQSNFKKGICTFYHPIYFLSWLYKTEAEK